MNRLAIIAIVATTLWLPTHGFAQDEVGEGTGSDGQPPKGGVDVAEGSGDARTTYEQRESGLVEIRHHENGTVTERPLSAAEAERMRAEKKVPAVRASHLCHGEAHANPRRLAPGQSGQLKVLVTLGGKSVALPGPHIKLALQPADGLEFGAAVLQPARAGTREGKFLGQPVYDDFLLFHVPLTVAADAPAGKVGVSGAVELELVHGGSGAGLGRYVADVGGQVHVGKRLPAHNLLATGRVKARPETATGAGTGTDRKPQAVAGQKRDEPAADGGPAEPAVVPDQRVGSMERPAPEEAGGTPPVLVGGEPDVEVGASNLLLLYGGGGFLAVFVVVLLLRRRG